LNTGYVTSHHMDDKSPLKLAWSGSRDPFYILRPQWYLWNCWSKSCRILCTSRLYHVLADG